MPKLNRQQRFATLKNIFNELGEKAFMRHAARLQVPAEEARTLLDELKGNPAGGESLQYEADEVVKLERKPRPVSRQAPEREPRPVKAQFTREPRPVSRPTVRPERPVTAKDVTDYALKKAAERTGAIRMGEASLPKEVESGVMVMGYEDCELRKGTHVRHIEGNAVGVILAIGPQQCEVKWFRTGATQAEITDQLKRAK